MIFISNVLYENNIIIPTQHLYMIINGLNNNNNNNNYNNNNKINVIYSL